MKLIIASDIHGSAYWTERLMSVIDHERPDHVVLLGDLLYHGPRNDLPRDYAPKRAIALLNELALSGRLVAVRGNCEAEVDQMVLDFPCMADSATLIDPQGRIAVLHARSRVRRGHAQQRRPCSRPSSGLRAAVRAHARQKERPE